MLKNKSIFSFTYLFLFSLTFFPPISANAQLADTLVTLKPSIVGVGTFMKTRRPPANLLGTGFVVADGKTVVTNAHVLPNDIDVENNEELTVFIGAGKDAKIRKAQVLQVDKVHDLALLEIVSFELPALKISDIGSVREGELFAFTGFPIGAVLGLYPVTHRGIISAISPIAIPVTSTKDLDITMIKRLQNPYDVYQLDATAYPGNSGSPLYDPDTGEVVGVINKVFIKQSKETVLEKPSGITYAIPARYVKALLKDANISE